MNNFLPDGWEEVELGQLLDSLQSGSRPQGGVRTIESGIPSLGGEHIGYDGKVHFDNIKYVPNSYADAMSKGRIQHNDILIVKDGATTGKVAFIDSSFQFAYAVVNEHVFICRPSPLLNAKTLFWFLWSKEGQERILENYTGTAIGGINRTFANNTFIPLAPFLEQGRILQVIEEMLSQVEKVRNRLETFIVSLQQYRQDILSAAVSGDLTEDWREDNFDVENAESLVARLIEERLNIYQKQFEIAQREGLTKPKAPKFNTNLVDTRAEYYEIPDSWLWTRLMNVADITGGIQKGKDVNGQATISLPYLRVANVQDGYFDLSDIKEIAILPKEKEKYLLRKKDILFTEGGDRDKLGRGAIWQGAIEEIVHQNHVFKARVLSDFILPEYISLFTKTEVAKNYFFTNATQSSNLSSISMTTLGNTPIALPPIEEQREIMRRIDEFTKLADRLEAKFLETKIELDTLPQLILAKAFAGELTEQNSSDEPASALLERIRNEREARQAIPKPKKARVLKPIHDTSAQVQMELLEVLQAHEGPMKNADLWKASRYKEDVEGFYAALREAVEVVKTVRETSDKTHIELVPTNEN